MKNDEFQILWRFLEQFGPEVKGRSAEQPPREIQDALRAFASGSLETEPREQLIDQLKKHPEWIQYLVKEVKARRTPSSSN